MKIKLSSLLKKVFLGSIAGIASTNTITAENRTIHLNSNFDDNKIMPLINKKADLTKKLLLKRNSSNVWFGMAHRSHRSHSSHRSHYSSSSGGSYTPSTTSYSSGSSYTPSTSSSGSGGSSSSYNSGNSSVSSSPQTFKGATSSKYLKLGSRTLIKGMSGTDVTELINILLSKKYLTSDSGQTHVSGSYVYDETIEDTIKQFQSDNGLQSDGICGATTIYYLKNL
jgi:hypothetical protein